MMYCYPKLPRYGLGNKLFEWARCRIFSHIHQIPMLAPIWAQVPAGLFIPEFRKQFYIRTFYLNLFHPKENDIQGLDWARLQFFSHKIAEPSNISHLPIIDKNRDNLIVFKRWEPNPFPQRRFSPLFGWSKFLNTELRQIIKPKILDNVPEVPSKSLGVHVRLELHQFGEIKTRDYLDWFIQSIRSLRELTGENLKVYVSSDSSREKLASLLEESNTEFLRGNAISDLLTLSKTSLLLVTDFSSFGAWASYLGQMPTLCHPSAKYRDLYFHEDFELKNEYGRYIGPFDPKKPKELLLDLSHVG